MMKQPLIGAVFNDNGLDLPLLHFYQLLNYDFSAINKTDYVRVKNVVNAADVISKNFEVVVDYKHQDAVIVKFNEKYHLLYYFPNYRKILYYSTDEKFEETFIEILSKYGLILDSKSYMVFSYFKNNRSLDWSAFYIDFEDLNLDPNLFKLAGIDPDKLTESFVNSKNSILLLFGEPGTGKSKLSLYVFMRAVDLGYIEYSKLFKGIPVIELLIEQYIHFYRKFVG